MNVKKTSAAPKRVTPTRNEISALAYAIWIDRGRPEGRSMEHWLEAEQQLHGMGEPQVDEGRVDVDTSRDARIDRKMERMVAPPAQRSPTSL